MYCRNGTVLQRRAQVKREYERHTDDNNNKSTEYIKGGIPSNQATLKVIV